ncbi:MAG TPA: AAA family ATPase [Polyangiaceae bacterium]
MAEKAAKVAQLKIVPDTFDDEALGLVRERVRKIIETVGGYSQSLVSREASLSTTTLSLFLSDTYTGNNQKVAKKLADWLNTRDEQESFDQLPEAPAWVDTPTSNRVLTALRYARLTNGIVLICGVAGVGKTKAIEQYAVISPNVWHVELSAATGNLRGALEEIASAVGIREIPRGVSAMQRAIATKVRGTKGVLVIDEAQHCTVRTLDEIRWFNDKCGIGVVFAGNERVHTQFSPGGERARYLDRLYSRICKKVMVNKATPGDIAAILDAWDVENEECTQIATAIAMQPGALRMLTLALRLAATNATAKGTTISARALRGAAHELEVPGIAK